VSGSFEAHPPFCTAIVDAMADHFEVGGTLELHSGPTVPRSTDPADVGSGFAFRLRSFVKLLMLLLIFSQSLLGDAQEAMSIVVIVPEPSSSEPPLRGAEKLSGSR